MYVAVARLVFLREASCFLSSALNERRSSATLFGERSLCPHDVSTNRENDWLVRLISSGRENGPDHGADVNAVPHLCAHGNWSTVLLESSTPPRSDIVYTIAQITIWRFRNRFQRHQGFKLPHVTLQALHHRFAVANSCNIATIMGYLTFIVSVIVLDLFFNSLQGL
jgi:hypothetical protein